MGRWPNSHVDDGTDDDTVMDHINNQHETLQKIWAPAPKPKADAPKEKEGDGEKKEQED